MEPPDNLENTLRSIIQRGRVHRRGGADLSAPEFDDYGKDRLPLAPNHKYIVLPADTEEAAALVRYAFQNRLALTPSGGRTGLAGGASATDGEIIVSMGRMIKILGFDASGPTLDVEAGVITKSVQDEAQSRGFYFPIDFASAGSSQIGGNAATNAGGIHVIRYGTMRNFVLALTVVTGTGEVLRLGAPVLKDNTGYDLKDLFIGSEGTLGLITELTLRLVRPPKARGVILFGAASFDQIIALFEAALRLAQPLRAFECFDQASLRHVKGHLALSDPFEGPCLWHGLVEVEDTDNLDTAAATLADQAGIDFEFVLTGSGSRAAEIWRYRESISESLSVLRPHKYDVSIPVAQMTAFVAALPKTVLLWEPGAEIVLFGHVGDGNLHVNLVLPPDKSQDSRTQTVEKLDEAVYHLVTEMRGSISAEHGIGVLKRRALTRAKPPAEIEAMRRIKAVFDPAGIMNPGKIFV